MSEGLPLFDNEAMRQSATLLDKISRTLEERLPSATKKTEESTAKAADKMRELSDSLESGLRTFNELGEAAGRLAGIAQALGEAAVAAEQQDAAITSLGASYDKLRTNTAGSVSAIDLERNRHALLQSGLKLTADQYEVLARAAHDHTAANHTTTEELDKLAEALRSGSAEALTQYGVKVKEGESRAKAASAAIAHFREEQKKSGPVHATTKDAVAGMKNAFNELTASLVGAIAKALSLREAFISVSSQLKTLGRDIAQYTGNDAAGQAARQAGVASSFSEIAARSTQLAGRADLRQRIAVLQSQIQDSVRGQGGQFSVGDTGQLSDQQLGALFTRLRDLRSRTSSGSMAALGFSGGANANAAQIVAAEQQAIYAEFDRDAAREAQSRREADARRTAVIAATTQATPASTNPNRVVDSLRVREGGGGGPSAQDLAEMARKLQDNARGAALADLQRALQAASGSGSSRQLEGDIASVGQIDTLVAKLRETALKERAELDSIAIKLAQRNLTLKQRLELEERSSTVAQQYRSSQQALLAVEERQRTLKIADLNVLQQTVQAEASAFATAIASREAGLKLTQSENETLNNRASIVSRLRELEAGLVGAARDAGAEAQAATTQEAKNAALIRELQLRQQIAQVQAQARTEETAERERALKNDFGSQLSKRFLGNVADTTTQAQRFAGVASDAFNQLGEGFSANLVAVIEGQKSFGDAMVAMTRDFLAAMTKMAVIEVIRNTAQGFAALATYQYPSAVSHFTAAAIWGGIGLAAGAGLAGVSAATRPSASTPAGAASGASGGRLATNNAASERNAGGGGNLTLVVNVSGAAITDRGVSREVTKAWREGFARGDMTAGQLQRLSG